jgi:hypothetical protein
MSDEQKADFLSLFAEKSLWQIYSKSGGFYKNRFNRIAVLCVFIILAAFSVFRLRSTSGYDFLRDTFFLWSGAGLTYSSTILGFLVAGFAVLFTVLRPQTAYLMTKLTRKGETMNELKLVFVTFVEVFVQYTAFVFWCVLYTVAGQKFGPIETAGDILGHQWPEAPVLVSYMAFVVWGTWFALIVLKLKSFIFNLYQSLMLGLADAVDDLLAEQSE